MHCSHTIPVSCWSIYIEISQGFEIQQQHFDQIERITFFPNERVVDPKITLQDPFMVKIMIFYVNNVCTFSLCFILKLPLIIIYSGVENYPVHIIKTI